MLHADRNVGIGGLPPQLLRRCAQLLCPGGSLLCETDPPGTGLRLIRTRLEPPAGLASDWFPWARTAPEAVAAMAGAAGLTWAGEWTDHGRWFAALRRP